MKKILIKYIPLLTLPLCNAALAEETTALADADADANSTLTLETMAVTATVSDAKLGGIDIKTLPVASTIVNQEEIKRLKYVEPDELLDRIPGETLVRNLRIPSGSKSYTIPLIDGAALGSPYRGSTQAFSDTINSQDIERIEIFKGPVSALYPNNSFGGVINVVSKGSSQLPKQNTRLWTEVGNYDRYRGGVSTQGNLKDVGYLFDFSSWNISQYRDQGELTTGRIFDTGEERQQGSVKLMFNPDDVSSLVVRGSYLNDHLADPGEIFTNDFIANDKGIGRNTGFFSDDETFIAGAIYKRDLSDTDHIEANFNYKHLDTQGFSRFSGFQDDITIDINGKASYKHDFGFWNSNIIIGTDIFHGSNDDHNFKTTSRRGPRTTITGASTDFATTDIYAGFAQIQFSPIENLQITAGVRHESIDLNHTRSQLENSTSKTGGGPISITTAAGTVVNNSASYSATLPKVGISYDFLETQRIWAAYGEGFRAPTTGELYTAGRGRANPHLNPEEAEHFEIGLRGVLPLFGRDLTYDTSYYYQDISQYIVASDPDGTNVRNVNAGKVNIQGVETVLEYQPYDFIRFGITHTYASNIYKKFIDANNVNLSGEELSRSPEHHINGRVAVMPMEGLAIEVGVDSQTSYSTLDNSSLDPQGRFTRDERINLRLTYDKGPYELWFHALNIGDVKEDRVGFDTRSGKRSIRTVDGLQLYGGIAYNF